MLDKTLIGSEEWCAFPQLGIPAIKARIDSGAKTSALHAINIKTFQKNNEDWLRFDINPIQNNSKSIIHCEAQLVDQRIVKSSSGTREKRYVIRTEIKLGEHNYSIEVTLTNRDSMGYRMLLGREAMVGRLIVDPERRFVLGQPSSESLKEYYYKETNKKGLKIGLLASNPDLYSNRRIIEAGEMRGHEMHFLNLKYCYMKLSASNPEIHYRGGLVLQLICLPWLHDLGAFDIP
jgi:ribosomal protein S6--L-glutamate ligase